MYLHSRKSEVIRKYYEVSVVKELTCFKLSLELDVA
jgi:hypothetical protein